MLKVGLTGGISSGKTAVSEMFSGLGVHVIQADAISHELMQPGEDVYQQVVQEFGAGILNPDGTVNRPKLAEAAFGSPNQTGPWRVETLNRIVHPAVVKRQDDWMAAIGAREPHAIAMVEAALILEAKMEGHFDRLVVVTCRPEQRVVRWAKRLKVDEETARREVTRRMAAQLPDEQKIKAADFVIDNSGSLDKTREQVDSVFRHLQKDAAAT